MPFGLENLTPEQKKLAMYGVPIVGGLVLLAKLRGKAPAAAATSSPGAMAGPVVAPSTSAIDTGQLTSFESSITDALAGVQSGLASDFAQALAGTQQTFGKSINDALLGVQQSINQLETRSAATPPPPSTPTTPTSPPPAPAPPTAPLRYSEQQVSDLFKQLGKNPASSSETASQRVARIARQLNAGDRTWDQVVASVKILAPA